MICYCTQLHNPPKSDGKYAQKSVQLVRGSPFRNDLLQNPYFKKSVIPEKMLDSYCWIHSTFTVPSRWDAKVGKEVVYPGIAPVKEGQDKQYYKWYQWVVFFLTFQCVMFYLPRYFWKASENGKVKMLVGKLQEPLLSDAEKKKQIKKIGNYFEQHRGTHALYAFRFFGLEIYNFVNTVCQIFFIDYFLDGEFMNYGLEVNINSYLRDHSSIMSSMR